jgi:hypothetical protein
LLWNCDYVLLDLEECRRCAEILDGSHMVKATLILLVLASAVVLAVEGILNPFAWWNLTPLAGAAYWLRRSRRAPLRASALAAAVAGVQLAAHLAWQANWRQIATGSSTSGLVFVTLPLITVGAGLAAMGISVLARLAWQRVQLPTSVPLGVALPPIVALLSAVTLYGFGRDAAPAWPELGVRQDSGTLRSDAVVDSRFAGRVRTIQFVEAGPHAGTIAVLGQSDVEILDSATLRTLERIEPRQDTSRIWFGLSPALLFHEGRYRVLERGGGFGAVRIRELDGSVAWDFGGATGDDASAAVLVPTRDGRPLRIIVAARRGLYGFDARGALLWRVQGEFSHVSGAEQGSQWTAVARRGASVLRVDETGAEVGSFSPAVPVREVVFLPEFPRLFGRTGTGFVAMDTAGAVLREWRLDPAGRSMQMAAANFGLPEDPHLAVLVTSSSGIGRASLVIFDAGGNIAYHRILESSTGLLAVRRPSGDLLLAGDGVSRVWMLQRRSGPGFAQERSWP